MCPLVRHMQVDKDERIGRYIFETKITRWLCYNKCIENNRTKQKTSISGFLLRKTVLRLILNLVIFKLQGIDVRMTQLTYFTLKYFFQRVYDNNDVNIPIREKNFSKLVLIWTFWVVSRKWCSSDTHSMNFLV